MIPPIVLYVLVEFSIYLIVTLSLNLEVGFAGIPQFGRVLAVIAGAFAVGAIPGRIMAAILGYPAGAEYASYQYNYKILTAVNKILENDPLLSIALFVSSLVIAMILGAVIGYITSRPAIRLKEAYLGITLLAMGDVLMLIGWYYTPLIGGTTSIMVPDPFRWTGELRFTAAAFTILGIALLVLVFVERLARSPFGRILRAMRDAELAAIVYGKDIVKLRTHALIVGSSLAALGGALYVFFVGSCTAIAFTRLTWTFWPWAFMMLGGTGNNVGVLVGVLVFSTVRTLIYSYKGVLSAIIPISPTWLEYLLVGLAIVLIALFRPQGLIPEKPALTLPRKRIEEIARSKS